MTRSEIDKGLARLERGFMTPRVWRDDVWEVSANHGETHYVLADLSASAEGLADYVEGTIDVDDDDRPIATLRRGVWCAQLSAAGYMDQTDLSIHNSEAAAEEYLVDTYDDGTDDDDDDDGADDGAEVQ